MGLAAGCPARFGFAGGRRGLPPLAVPEVPGAIVAPGAMGRTGAGPGLGVGILGTAADAIGAVRGAPGDGGAFGNSPRSAGRGWRGPERICPGLGPGTGLAGIADPRASVGREGGTGGAGAGDAAMGAVAAGPAE